MSAGPDDLELLINDVRKTIAENERFLQTLMEDTVDSGLEPEDAEESVEEEEYEEL